MWSKNDLAYLHFFPISADKRREPSSIRLLDPGVKIIIYFFFDIDGQGTGFESLS